MNSNYNELFEKYKILEEENKWLRDEVERLRKLLSKEESGTDSSADFDIVKETSLEQNDNLVTMNSSSKERFNCFCLYSGVGRKSVQKDGEINQVIHHIVLMILNKEYVINLR